MHVAVCIVMPVCWWSSGLWKMHQWSLLLQKICHGFSILQSLHQLLLAVPVEDESLSTVFVEHSSSLLLLLLQKVLR